MANLIRRRTSSPISRASRDAALDPLSTWDDFLSPRILRRQIDRLFDDFFSGNVLGPVADMASAGMFVPTLELKESGNEYVMNAELPGMTADDVHVEVDDNNCLTIRGEKKSETSEARGSYDYTERSYGQFVRTVQLPSAVDASKIEANFENGVLALHIPKTEQANVRAIPIGNQPKQIVEAAGQKPGGDGSQQTQQETPQEHQEAR